VLLPVPHPDALERGLHAAAALGRGDGVLPAPVGERQLDVLEHRSGRRSG
jgi:hypothetical protein